MMKICVSGASGDMGRRVVRLLGAHRTMSYALGVDALEEKNVVKNTSDVLEVEGVIDFSSPSLALKMARRASELKIPFVTGTTGFVSDESDELKRIAETIPVFRSPNMSLGVNVLFKAAEMVSALLPDFDLEMMELHHKRKVDSPSGTALKIMEHASKTRDLKRISGRDGKVGPRKKDEFGVFALRGGDVAGEHTLYFLGPGERIELTHRVSDRDNFASGAIRALEFIMNKPAGLYSMEELLEFKD